MGLVCKQCRKKMDPELGVSMDGKCEACTENERDDLRARVAELEREQQYCKLCGESVVERCPECNGELSDCGEMTADGPLLGCQACLLRAQLAERDAEVEGLRDHRYFVSHHTGGAARAARMEDGIFKRAINEAKS